jgi:hypothetical protein
MAVPILKPAGLMYTGTWLTDGFWAMHNCWLAKATGKWKQVFRVSDPVLAECLKAHRPVSFKTPTGAAGFAGEGPIPTDDAVEKIVRAEEWVDPSQRLKLTPIYFKLDGKTQVRRLLGQAGPFFLATEFLAYFESLEFYAPLHPKGPVRACEVSVSHTIDHKREESRSVVGCVMPWKLKPEDLAAGDVDALAAWVRAGQEEKAA